MNRPQQHPRQALNTLLRYLKGTRTYCLQFNPLLRPDSNAQSQLATHSDADFANAKENSQPHATFTVSTEPPSLAFLASKASSPYRLQNYNTSRQNKQHNIQMAHEPPAIRNITRDGSDNPLHRQQIYDPYRAKPGSHKTREVHRYPAPLPATPNGRKHNRTRKNTV